MLISSAVIPVKAEPTPIPLDAERIDAYMLPEGNVFYVGTAAANLAEEDAVYEFPVYREGDLSGEASVTVHTIDMTAVYGEDYEIVDTDAEVDGDGKSILETLVTDAQNEPEELPDFSAADAEDTESEKILAENDYASDTEEDFDGGAEEKSLRELKEEQTGEDTRDPYYSEIDESITQEMAQVLVPEAMQSVKYSSEFTLTFAPNEGEKIIRFRIIDDNKSEGAEGFSIVLLNPENAELCSPFLMAVTIADDEPVVHSTVTFSNKSYRSKDGKVSVKITRKGAEYSLCKFQLRSSGDTAVSDENYSEINDEIVFLPYETEKNIDIPVRGSGEFKLLICELSACEEGKYTEASIKIDEPEDGEISPLAAANGIQIASSDGDVQSFAEGKKPTPSEADVMQEVTINGRDCMLCYNLPSGWPNTHPTMGYIYEMGYDVPPEVGVYYFPPDKEHGGNFVYDLRYGDSADTGGSVEASVYSHDESTGDMTKSYAHIKYYNQIMWEEGGRFARSEDQFFEPIYFQFAVPNWVEYDAGGNDNRIRFSLGRELDGDSSVVSELYGDVEDEYVGTGDKNGEYNSEMKPGRIELRESDPFVKYYVQVTAMDHNAWCPASYMRYYGMAAMYKRYDIQVKDASSLTYKRGWNKDKEAYDTYAFMPFQVSTDNGVDVGDGKYRGVYTNIDEASQNMVIDVKTAGIDNHNGIFGTIKGYDIMITPGDSQNQVKLSYPEDFLNFVNETYGNEAYNAEHEKVYKDLNQIVTDKYFISWIGKNEKRTYSDGSDYDGYHQKLDITPKADYLPINVTVLSPIVNEGDKNDGAFVDPNLEIGTHQFNVGDQLNMESVAYDTSRYEAVGYAVSYDNGTTWDFIASEENRDTLFLEQDYVTTGYTVRPLIVEKKNRIEVIYDNGAENYLEVQNLISQDELEMIIDNEDEANKAADEELLGRNFIDMSLVTSESGVSDTLPSESLTGAAELSARLNPTVGSIYTINIMSKEDENYTYRPVITHKGNAASAGPYTTNSYHLTAGQLAGDNVIHISYKKVAKKELTSFKLKGSILIKSNTIRDTTYATTSTAASGYTISAGAGTQSKSTEVSNDNSKYQPYEYTIDGVSTTAGEDGTFLLDGVHGQAGDVITVLASNDIFGGQVINVTLSDRGSVDRESGNFVVNMQKVEMAYPEFAPSFRGVSYYYTGGSVDDTDNTISISDKLLTLQFSVDPNGHKVKKVMVNIVSTTGATTEYTAEQSTSDSNSYTVSIEGLTETAHSGDRIYAYIVADDGQTATSDELDDNGEPTGKQVVNQIDTYYPVVDTGLMFQNESNKTKPQTYDYLQAQTVDIPIIGSATGMGQTGKINLKKLDWEDGNGYTYQLNFDTTFDSAVTPTNKDKMNKVKQFHEHGKKMPENQALAEDLMLELTVDEAMGAPWGEFEDPSQFFEKNGKYNDEIDMMTKLVQAQKDSAWTGFNSKKLSVNAALLFAFDFVFSPETNSYIFSYGTVAIGGTFTFNKTLYVKAFKVPIFVNLVLTLQGNLVSNYSTAEGRNAFDAGYFTGYEGNLADLMSEDYNGDFNVMLTGKIQGGVGVCGVLSARGYASLTIQYDLQCSTLESGALFTITGGIGIDLLLFSFDIDIVSGTFGFGTLSNKSSYSLFGGLVSKGTIDISAFEPLSINADADGDGDKVIASDETQTVSEHTYSNGSTDMSGFGAGSEVMPMSVPKAVSIHTLLNNAAERTRPHIIPLGDGRKLVTFIGNNADRDEANGATLYYSVYDGAWSIPQPVAEDGTADSDPIMELSDGKVYIAWADANGTSDADDGTAEVLNRFGISMAVYDVKSGTMGDEITVTDDRFMNSSPQLAIDGDNVYVSYIKRDLTDMQNDIELMDAGYLYSTMASVTYNAATGAAGNERLIPIRHELTDPLVEDYQTQIYKTGGKTFMLSAYTVDGDEDIYTPEDRELYLEIANLDTGEEYYPIRITNNAVADTTPQLTELNGEVYLTWLEDGYMFDIINLSGIIGNMFDSEQNGGVSAYEKADKSVDGWWIQSAGEVGMSEEEYDGTIFSKIAKGDFNTARTNLRGNPELMTGIGSYKLVTDGDNVYVFYTEPNHDHESSGMEIFGARMESGGTFTTGVQITDEDKVIDELDLYMNEDGKMGAVSNYYSQWIDGAGHIQYGDNSLVEIDFEPESSVKIEDGISFPNSIVPGTNDMIDFSVKNDGLLDAHGYNIKVSEIKDSSENVIFDRDYDTILKSGETTDISVPWTIPDDAANTEIKVEIAEHGANGSITETEKVPYEARPQMSEVNVMRNKNEYTASAKIVNNGNLASEATTAELTALDSNYNKIRSLGTVEIPSVEAGGETEVSITFKPNIKDFDAHQYINLKLATENGEEAYGKILGAVPVIAEINGGAESVDIAAGETAPIETKAAPWGLIAGNVQYYSSDNGVAVVNDDGEIVGVSEGTATIYAYYTLCGAEDEITVNVLPSDQSGGGETETSKFSISVEDNVITVTIDRDAVVIAADYDPDTNKLKGVYTKAVKIADGELQSINAADEWGMTEIGSEDKIMLWDSLDKMTPLSDTWSAE